MTAFAMLVMTAAAFPEPTQFDAKPSAVRLDDDSLAVAYAPDGKLVATASSDRRIALWDTKDWSLVKSLRGHGGPVRGVAFSPDGKLLASCAEDASVYLWNVAERKIERDLVGHEGAVTGIAFS